MIQIQLSPYMEIETERRLEELRKEAIQTRLAQKAQNEETQQKNRSAHLLARIGKGIVAIGCSLEERYGEQPDDCHNTQQLEYQ